MDGAMNEETRSRGRDETAETRRVLYCVLPAGLAFELHDRLREHFSDLDDLEVIVERRRRDRRAEPERRTADEGPPTEAERRRIRNAEGRRVADRRGTRAPAEIPALPRFAGAHRELIVFQERFEPSSLALEDVDTARLVTRIQGGEDAGFATIYSRYFERVYSYLRAMLRDGHEAEDATQQTFVNALEALDSYERRRQPFRGWLFSIARNCGTDSMRRGGRVQLVGPEELDRRMEELVAKPDRPITEWISDRSLARDFSRLPDAQQQVLVLRFLLDLSVRETARALGHSEDNVKTLQSRALGVMRKHGLAAAQAQAAAV